MGPNNKLYRELNQPLESVSQLNKAIGAFIVDVEEARKKHRILNIVMMMQCPVESDGDELMMGSDGGANAWPDTSGQAEEHCADYCRWHTGEG